MKIAARWAQRETVAYPAKSRIYQPP